MTKLRMTGLLNPLLDLTTLVSCINEIDEAAVNPDNTILRMIGLLNLLSSLTILSKDDGLIMN
jgi:hypothetical protein